MHVESFESQAEELRSSQVHVEEKVATIHERDEEVKGLKHDVKCRHEDINKLTDDLKKANDFCEVLKGSLNDAHTKCGGLEHDIEKHKAEYADLEEK